jgi:hypothetical protein
MMLQHIWKASDEEVKSLMEIKDQHFFLMAIG